MDTAGRCCPWRAFPTNHLPLHRSHKERRKRHLQKQQQQDRQVHTGDPTVWLEFLGNERQIEEAKQS